jgi:hypothetical protein
MKAKWGRVVGLCARSQDFVTLKGEKGPWHWEYEIGMPAKGKRPDPGNILAGADKIIPDALQEAGLLENDGWSQVASISAVFVTAKEPYVKLSVSG